jgi:hypothetical protein
MQIVISFLGRQTLLVMAAITGFLCLLQMFSIWRSKRSLPGPIFAGEYLFLTQLNTRFDA